MRIYRAFVIALILASAFVVLTPRPVSAMTCEPDERGRCSWRYELWSFGTCYGWGPFCWRSWY